MKHSHVDAIRGRAGFQSNGKLATLLSVLNFLCWATILLHTSAIHNVLPVLANKQHTSHYTENAYFLSE